MIRRFSSILVALLISINLMGMLGCVSSSPPDLATMVEEVRSGVVRIETVSGSGSGVIFDAASGGSALVLTNYHVVEDADPISIEVADSATYEGHIQGFDADIDLAVLSICCGDFLSLPFGDVSSIKPGSEVIAIGYPLGLPGAASVTRGIVSAIRSEGDFEIIQMDAPINPGNSGGPLLSLSGDVLGINTFSLRDTEGLAFALSERTVQAILPELMEKNGLAVARPNRTPSPTPRNTPTPTPRPTATATPWPTATPNRIPKHTPSLLRLFPNIPKLTATPTPMPTSTPRLTATARPKPTPTPTLTPTPTPVPTHTPLPTYMPLPTYTPVPFPTATPYPTATPPVARGDYFTVGSTKDAVLAAQGSPNRFTDTRWEYGLYSWVRFQNGRVIDWNDTGLDKLNARLEPSESSSRPTGTPTPAPTPLPLPTVVPIAAPPVTGGDYFTRGSSQDDVLHVQDSPTEIHTYSALGREDWYYDRSKVSFSLPDRRVTEWDNNGNLMVRLLPRTGNSSTPGYFTRGSSQDDVLHVQGTPTEIHTYSALGREDWYYDRSKVSFSLPDRRVTEWDNNGNLKVRLLPRTGNSSTPGYFTRGSSQDDVLHVQGTPTEIHTYSALGREDWYYDRSKVSFSLPDRRVTEWDNNGNLKVRLLPRTGNSSTPGYFTRGSSQDDVLHVQGTPTEIHTYSALGHEDWYYDRSKVSFSLPDRRVTEWDNNGNLKVK